MNPLGKTLLHFFLVEVVSVPFPYGAAVETGMGTTVAVLMMTTAELDETTATLPAAPVSADDGVALAVSVCNLLVGYDRMGREWETYHSDSRQGRGDSNGHWYTASRSSRTCSAGRTSISTLARSSRRSRHYRDVAGRCARSSDRSGAFGARSNLSLLSSHTSSARLTWERSIHSRGRGVLDGRRNNCGG
jgi:hypothetical protein